MSRRDEIVTAELINAQQIDNGAVLASQKAAEATLQFMTGGEGDGEPGPLESSFADLRDLKVEDAVGGKFLEKSWDIIDKKLAAEGLAPLTPIEREYWGGNLPEVMNPADIGDSYSFIGGKAKDAIFNGIEGLMRLAKDTNEYIDGNKEKWKESWDKLKNDIKDKINDGIDKGIEAGKDLKEAYEDALNDVRDVVDGLNKSWESFVRDFNADVDRVNALINERWSQGLSVVPRYDPLVLDIDGDGVETIAANSGITFDFDGDGLKTGTGWVNGDDGFLVLDRQTNGVIDNGGELFGVDTIKSNGQKAKDGFDALRDLDSNADGVFDSQDTEFTNVRIWQDLNQDGVSQTHELKSLANHNIIAINLGSTSTNQNSNGNLISAVGTFVRGDGSESSVNGNLSQAANLDLASNPPEFNT